MINDLDIKFITQQHVTRAEGRALTDLFFPQLALHIEVDESHHEYNIDNDKVREADIVNATGHKFERINVKKKHRRNKQRYRRGSVQNQERN